MPFTLLLADKSPTIRRVIELTFAAEEVTVNAAADGREAMTAIEANPPDILLADAGMAPPDGYDLAAFVKRTPDLARIPVILLTAAFQPVDQARAAASGCDAVLEKPFELDQLVAKVKELLAHTAGLSDDAPAHALEERPPEGVADRSLDDRLDAIDAVLADDPARTGAEVERPPVLLEARENAWSSDPRTGRLLLVDCFDLIDENVGRATLAGGRRELPAEGAVAEQERDPENDDGPGGAITGGDPAGDETGDPRFAALRRTFLALLGGSGGARSGEDAERIVRQLLEEPPTSGPNP